MCSAPIENRFEHHSSFLPGPNRRTDSRQLRRCYALLCESNGLRAGIDVRKNDSEPLDFEI
jgi:hypothetical protein